MESIVYLEPKRNRTDIFTTSEVIAEYAQVSHHAIQQIITKHEKDFLDLGISAFEMRKLNGRGRPEKIYRLNEQQATLLMTYLKNTAPVREFKKELVRQFYLMREELIKRQRVKEVLKPVRRSLTDSIKDNPDKGKWSYKLYTDLAYKYALGKTSAQIKKERGAERNVSAAECLTGDELEQVTAASDRIAVLHDMGLAYETIRALVLQSAVIQP